MLKPGVLSTLPRPVACPARLSFRPALRRLGFLALLLPLVLSAEVTRVEIAARTAIAGSDYEKITGVLHFAVDPADPRNGVIADLALAPRNARGRVEFSSTFYVLQPRDPARSNGAALFEISNRGGRTSLRIFNPGLVGDPANAAGLGDRFLFARGFTLIGVGWEFDVPAQPGLLRIQAPVATDRGAALVGTVRVTFTPPARAREFTVTDALAYATAETGGRPRRLLVRDNLAGSGGAEVPPEQWSLDGATVKLPAGFAPGRTYELHFTAEHPPVAGLGFAAIRDAGAWLKAATDGVRAVKRLHAFGSSQSGRFLRDFLYQGFNRGPAGAEVFDGIIAHIAGGARLDLNRRWSVPRAQAMYDAASFPFADPATVDPVSGHRDGVLDHARGRPRARVFYTNSSAEYWGGGRVAALAHADPERRADLALPENVRSYAFAGTQHGPAGFPPNARARDDVYPNPVDFSFALRALLLALDRWVADGAAPPASVYPRFQDGTLVTAGEVRFPRIAGLPSPVGLQAGVRRPNPLWPDGAGSGAPLPLFVPALDADGNERGAILLPEAAAPLATATGFAWAEPLDTGHRNLIPLRGSWVPFATTAEERARRGDGRPSLTERYRTRENYLATVRGHAERSVRAGFLLADDVDEVVRRAGVKWDWIWAQPAP